MTFGLYYYDARWYDPALGRFIQADTIVPDAGDVLAFDRYAYVKNNPLRYVDPTGHRSCSAHEAELDSETCEQNYSNGYDKNDRIMAWSYVPGYDDIRGVTEPPEPARIIPSYIAEELQSPVFSHRIEIELGAPPSATESNWGIPSVGGVQGAAAALDTVAGVIDTVTYVATLIGAAVDTAALSCVGASGNPGCLVPTQPIGTPVQIFDGRAGEVSFVATTISDFFTGATCISCLERRELVIGQDTLVSFAQALASDIVQNNYIDLGLNFWNTQVYSRDRVEFGEQSLYIRVVPTNSGR